MHGGTRCRSLSRAVGRRLTERSPNPGLRWRLAPSVQSVAADAWNALDLGGVPFLRHEFLAALEHSGAVGGDTGWRSCPLLLERDDTLVGAVPLYEKQHSWGEFVFDFSWAKAYARNGLDYYPKLIAATPFTPATGPRLLMRPGEDETAVREILLAGLRDVGREASSTHIQFTTAAEARWLETQGFMTRIDCQFHWQNRGYRDFADFLDTFTADKRKKAKRERRRIEEAGIRYEWSRGDQLSPTLWQAVYALKAHTFHRHGHEPYLPLRFFTDLPVESPVQPEVLVAWQAQIPVATAIFFRGERTLYGRYWGAAGDFHSLHFETCYHQGIEYCIREGLAHFEPGTQGEHKIARGFQPTLTYSSHHIADPRFREAIGRYLIEEGRSVEAYAAAAAEHVPFKTSPQELDSWLPGGK